MGEFFESFKNEVRELLQNRKHLVSILILGILILAIPIGMELLKNQRIIRSRASGDPIAFVESDDVFQKEGKWFTKNKKISLKITSPLGGPVSTAAPTTSVPTTAPTTSPTQTPTTAPTQAPTAAATSQALTAPTGLTRTCSQDGASAVFSWNVVSGAASYSLRINKDPFADWRGPGDTERRGLTATTQTVPITPNINYEWKVSSAAGSNEVDSPLLRFSCPGPTQAPTAAPTSSTSITILTLTGSCSGTAINLSWNPVAGASKYLVRIDDTANGWGGYNRQPGDIIDDNVASASYTNNSGQAGHNYQVWVHSADSSNNLSESSNKVTISCR